MEVELPKSKAECPKEIYKVYADKKSMIREVCE